MTNQGELQGAIRALTGTANTYNGDWHALFDDYGITSGNEYNGRLVEWLQEQLLSSSTNLGDLMQQYATMLGYYNWNSIRGESFAGRAIVNSTTLSDEITFTRASSAYAFVDGVLTSFGTNAPRFGSLSIERGS
jgi:hypothetical protein